MKKIALRAFCVLLLALPGSASSASIDPLVVGRLVHWSDQETRFYPLFAFDSGRYIKLHYGWMPAKPGRPAPQLSFLDKWLDDMIHAQKQFHVYLNGRQIGLLNANRTTTFSLQLPAGDYVTSVTVEKTAPPKRPLALSRQVQCFPDYQSTTATIVSFRDDIMSLFKVRLQATEQGRRLWNARKGEPEFKLFKVVDLDLDQRPEVVAYVELGNKARIFVVFSYSAKGRQTLFEECQTREMDDDDTRQARQLEVLDLDGDDKPELIIRWGNYDATWFEVYTLGRRPVSSRIELLSVCVGPMEEGF